MDIMNYVLLIKIEMGILNMMEQKIKKYNYKKIKKHKNLV